MFRRAAQQNDETLGGVIDRGTACLSCDGSIVLVCLVEAPPHVFRIAADALGRAVESLEAFEYDPLFLRSWKFWLVGDGCLPPGEVYVAEQKGTAVLVLFDEGFEPLAKRDPVALANSHDAIEYVRMFIRTSRPGLQIREHVDEIPGLIPEVASAMTVEVVPPTARPTSIGGWEVTAFLNELDELDHARFSIAPGGKLTVSLHRVAEGISIFSTWE